jgi:ribosome-associated protein
LALSPALCYTAFPNEPTGWRTPLTETTPKRPRKTAAARPAAKAAATKTAKTVKTARTKAAPAPKAKAPAKAKSAPKAKPAPAAAKAPRPKKQASTAHAALLKAILAQLDDDKAEDVVTVELDGRSSLADALVIATGRSTRHVSSIAGHLAEKLRDGGFGRAALEGEAAGDWVIVDCGDVIVHLFRTEVRAFYDLEGMWKDASNARSAA